jgi:hypothetical protein
MKHIIGLIAVFGGITMLMYNGGPRLMSDFWHAREFIPAQHFRVTSYKCTNWNGFMFNECTTTFLSQQDGVSRQITDWRFGRAPHDQVQLLQLRDNASSVTTNVSLQTLWNRLLLALTTILFGVLFTLGLVLRVFKTGAAPSGRPAH